MEGQCPALQEGLEPICHQSQPLILSGYYCIIELGIEGQTLIAMMVSGGAALNSKMDHGFLALRQQPHATEFLRIKMF